MRRPLVEAGQHGLSCSRHMAGAIVFAHECLDCVEAVEPHQSLELYLIAEVTLHQIDVAETRNAPRLDAWNHFATDNPFVSVSILASGPSPPKPANHDALLLRGFELRDGRGHD